MNDIVQNQNPFVAPATAAPNTLAVVTEAEIQREVALIQTAATIAHTRPRDPYQCWQGIKNECSRVALAADAVYAYPRGGQLISDASIRLAEALARHWGHIHTSVRFLAHTRTETTVRVMAWDLQANLPVSLEFTVRHEREKRGRDGNPAMVPIESERDTYELVMNQAKRRLRQCILACIPGEIIDQAKLECDKTLAKLGRPEEVLQDVLTRMKAFGVEQKHIEDQLQRPLTQRGEIKVSMRDLVRLQRIAKAIEDGLGSPGAYFPTWEPTPARPTGVQTAQKVAARKSEVWPKRQPMEDGSVKWYGRGMEEYHPAKHETNADGSPRVSDDGTLVGKRGGGGRSRTEAPHFTMSPETHDDPDPLIERIDSATKLTEVEKVRPEVHDFPITHPRRGEVIRAFDSAVIRFVIKEAMSWPQELVMGDGRQATMDQAGEFWDPAKHATSNAGGPSMNQDGTFRARRRTKAQDAAPAPTTTRAPNLDDPPSRTGRGIYFGASAAQIRGKIEACPPDDAEQWDVIEDLLRDFPETDEQKPQLLKLLDERRPF